LQPNEWAVDSESTAPVRRFFLHDAEGKKVAFVFFDPIMDKGETKGYVTSFKRRSDSAPSVAEVGITRFAIEAFRLEGLTHLYLGLSPLAEIENADCRKNWFLHHSFRYLFRSKLFNRYCYNLAGHAQFKRRFRGVSEKVYFASPKLVNDVRLIGLLRLCRAI
jgi:phosphatidylglycerol lysyltransferase